MIGEFGDPLLSTSLASASTCLEIFTFSTPSLSKLKADIRPAREPDDMDFKESNLGFSGESSIGSTSRAA